MSDLTSWTGVWPADWTMPPMVLMTMEMAVAETSLALQTKP